MGTHPIFESDFDCLTEDYCSELSVAQSLNELKKSWLRGNAQFSLAARAAL